MESQFEESKPKRGKERLNELRERAKKILETINKKFELDRKKSIEDHNKFKKFEIPPPRKEFRVKARIPITISPETKKKLRQQKEIRKRAKTEIVIDLKEPKSRKSKIHVNDEKAKGKKSDINIQPPETPTQITSPTMKPEEPFNKDELVKKMKKIKGKRSRRKKYP